jgi:predicted RNA-binding Zn-ribbon protein involved in translation (DUF1610 family)
MSTTHQTQNATTTPATPATQSKTISVPDKSPMTLQVAHICYEHGEDYSGKVRELHDIVLEDEEDQVYFKCPECKEWLKHDMDTGDGFWYDYRDTFHVVTCSSCGVFVTALSLGEDENVLLFKSIKEYSFNDRKVQDKFRNKLKLSSDTPIDLFAVPLVKLDAYCNVNGNELICKDLIVEQPATYNAHSFDGIDFECSFVRVSGGQHDGKFVYLAAD